MSRFLAPAVGILGQGARTEAPSSGSRRSTPKIARLAHCRGCGVSSPPPHSARPALRRLPPSYDEATFERLRTWRLAVARDARVPAYVVFTDATLTAIAEREPSDEATLATISGGARKLAQYGADAGDPAGLTRKRSSKSAPVASESAQ